METSMNFQKQLPHEKIQKNSIQLQPLNDG